MDAEAFFGGGAAVARVVVTCVLAYAALVALLRVSGKRTLSQLNAFDWIVTVAFGSTLATTVLSADVALVDGVAALATLAALQLVVTFASTRVRGVDRLVKNEPALLAHRGRLLPEAMRRERITEEEVRQALRSSGVASLADVEAVVLETNGRLSVLPGEARGDRGALTGLVEDAGGDRDADADGEEHAK